MRWDLAKIEGILVMDVATKLADGPEGLADSIAALLGVDLLTIEPHETPALVLAQGLRQIGHVLERLDSFRKQHDRFVSMQDLDSGATADDLQHDYEATEARLDELFAALDGGDE